MYLPFLLFGLLLTALELKSAAKARIVDATAVPLRSSGLSPAASIPVKEKPSGETEPATAFPKPLFVWRTFSPFKSNPPALIQPERFTVH